jgi:hypothetical protein
MRALGPEGAAESLPGVDSNAEAVTLPLLSPPKTGPLFNKSASGNLCGCSVGGWQRPTNIDEASLENSEDAESSKDRLPFTGQSAVLN